MGSCKALLLRSHEVCSTRSLLDIAVPSSVCCAGGAPSTYRRYYRTRQSRPAAQHRAPASGLPGLPTLAWARALAQTGRRLPGWRPRSRHTGAAPCSAALAKPLSPALMQCSAHRLRVGSTPAVIVAPEAGSRCGCLGSQARALGGACIAGNPELGPKRMG